MRVYRLAAVACVLCVASAARADARNVVSRITVTDGAAGTAVRIVGTRAPSFTQFTLQGPQRVVIDLSGTVLAGPAAEVPGDGHLVRSIRTAMFESRDVSVARVTLEFAHPVTYAMHADGTDLVVSLHGAAGTGAVADDTAPATPRVAADTTSAARAEAARQASQAATALAKARAALAKAQTDRQAAEQRAAAETARAKAAEAARQAAVARLHERQATASKARTEAAHEALTRAEAARAAAEAQAAKESRARADAEAQAKALASARAVAEAKATAAEKKADEAQAEVARLRAQGRVVADAQAGVEPGQRYALADYQQGGMEGSGPAVAAGAPKVMELVGFRQKDKVSQVFIRTNEPARYTVNERDGAVIVEIENTQARTRNDLNFLDTRFFDSAVARIDPQEIEGAGTHIRIRIELKQKVPFEVKQVDNEIRIDFRRPAS